MFYGFGVNIIGLLRFSLVIYRTIVVSHFAEMTHFHSPVPLVSSSRLFRCCRTLSIGTSSAPSNSPPTQSPRTAATSAPRNLDKDAGPPAVIALTAIIASHSQSRFSFSFSDGTLRGPLSNLSDRTINSAIDDNECRPELTLLLLLGILRMPVWFDAQCAYRVVYTYNPNSAPHPLSLTP